MRKTPTYILPIILSLLGSCGDNQMCYNLINTGDQLQFPLDSRTTNSLLYMNPYKDKNGIEYLTFQNETKNEILFYDINTQKLKFKIEPEIAGDNGVGLFLGYHILNLDSIYLTNYDFQEISLIDQSAKVKDKIEYEYAEDGTPLSLFCFITHTYQPATIIGRKMYMYSGPNRFVEKDPVSVVMDLDKNTIQPLPFTYPEYPGSNDKRKVFGWEDNFSRCFDGRHFIYSFFFEEEVYVANIPHDSIQKVSVKSKYVNNVSYPKEFGSSPKELCEQPRYGNLLYDPYRDVYYRIAYPHVTIDEKKEHVRSMEVLEYGGKKFSIIILDKSLNIIGETLFPNYTYNPKLILILKDGIYICNSNPQNPDFSDDVLSFQKFELKKIQSK